ncbi:MAG: hypothetical protein AAF772_05280 [Acidobacteriota bacterium]
MNRDDLEPLDLSTGMPRRLADIFAMPSSTDDERAVQDAAFAAWRAAQPVRTCAGCGCEMRGPRPARERPRRRSRAQRASALQTRGQREAAIRATHCANCVEAALEAEALRMREAMPLRTLLRDTRVPSAHRGPFDPARACSHGETAWPRDHRAAFSGVDLETWDGDPRSVTIAGPTGAGKTRWAVELLTRLLRREVRSGLFVRASELIARGRDSEADVLLRDARTRDVVLIDDVGRGVSSQPRSWDVLSDLIDDRWAAQKITIVTTNLYITARGAQKAARHKRGLASNVRLPADITGKSLEEHSLSMYSRLCDGVVVQLDLPDQRGQLPPI